MDSSFLSNNLMSILHYSYNNIISVNFRLHLEMQMYAEHYKNTPYATIYLFFYPILICKFLVILMTETLGIVVNIRGNNSMTILVEGKNETRYWKHKLQLL